MFQPRLNIRSRLLQDILEIERLHERLKNLAVPDELALHIKKQCLIALTHFSNQIEGNQLSMKEVNHVIERARATTKIRDEQEVKNYFQLLETLPLWSQKFQGKLSKEIILAAHRRIQQHLVKGDLLGRYRKIQNAVYSGNAIVYLPPEPKDVDNLMKDLCVWVNTTDLHPLLRAGIFHAQFVTIHPFIDGNGRSARSLSLYLLMSQGWDFRSFVPVDRFYAEDRKRYYQLLQQDYPHNYYQGRCDAEFTIWLEYYVEGVRAMLAETLKELGQYTDAGILLNARQKALLRHLPPTKTITPRAYARRFDISVRMATRDLTNLTQWGYAHRIGHGRNVQYFFQGGERHQTGSEMPRESSSRNR